MRNIIVVDQLKDWCFKIDNIEIIAAADYLKNSITGSGRVRVFNFCKSYRYQSMGYYVALIAEARGHNAVPSLMAIEDIKSSSLTHAISEDFQELIDKALKPITSHEFTLSIYFKHNVAKHYDRLVKQLADRFQLPMCRVEFAFRHKHWVITDVSPISLRDIPEAHHALVEASAKSYFASKYFVSSQRATYDYDMAILVDEKEPNCPSNREALDNFIEAGKKFNIRCEIISKSDFSRLPEFDALFIRTTTAVNNFTYRFSRRAFVEGLVVVDDPLSIIRCGNKIFLHESLKKLKLPSPKSMVLQKRSYKERLAEIPLPCVLKLPDGSFSKGVVKAETQEMFLKLAEGFFETSDLLLVQGFVPTEFDWRIGIFDQEPLFACQYFMAPGHWQIYNWRGETADDQVGTFACVPIHQVPPQILDAALKASKLMGDGLYGVDLKQYKDQVYVIEVNDNPNIDAGVEDSLLGKALYEKIMQKFAQRLALQVGKK